jgi:hypothetical protein
MIVLTIHPEAVNPNKIALAANITVAKYRGFLYTASRYTFSPPERGNMVPYSSQTNSPQNDRTKPRTQSIRDAPTEPTDPRMEEGVLVIM